VELKLHDSSRELARACLACIGGRWRAGPGPHTGCGRDFAAQSAISSRRSPFSLVSGDKSGERRLMVAYLGGKGPRRLLSSLESAPVYAPNPRGGDGWLLYVEGGHRVARSFDPIAGEFKGGPRPIPQVDDETGGVSWSVPRVECSRYAAGRCLNSPGSIARASSWASPRSRMCPVIFRGYPRTRSQLSSSGMKNPTETSGCSMLREAPGALHVRTRRCALSEWFSRLVVRW
jgi:hypothetical protein